MVVSKRCKICAVLDPDSVLITGEYFGELIPDLITKICGIELDPRKANAVLICKPCVIQLVHTTMVIKKITNAVQRLQKNIKNTNPKTPLKSPTHAIIKRKISGDNGEKKVDETILNVSQSNADESKTLTEKKLNPPKKIARRKSVHPDEKLIHIIEENKQNGEADNVVSNTKVKKLMTNTKVASKRKLSLTTDDTINVPDDGSDADDTSYVKRNKKESISLRDESYMDFPIVEQSVTKEELKPGVMNCIICGKIFHSKTTLRDHIETAHMGERLKECPHCSSEFRSQQKYESHVFSERCKNKNHICQYPSCLKRFKTANKMQLHMQEKHSSEKNADLE